MSKRASIIMIAVTSLLAIGLIVSILISSSNTKKYEEELANKDYYIEDLEWQLTELGATEIVYKLACNVNSGTAVKDTDLEAVEIPVGMVPGYIIDKEEIIGKYYKISYDAGTLLTHEMMYEVPLKTDDRILDIMCDRQPVGFKAGDIVDVRITFPDGQDYLLMHKKLVQDVYGNAMRLVVDEKDILVYKSAEADWARFVKNGKAGTSVQIYCTMYVEAGIQSAIRYYPIQTVLPDGETFEGSILWVAAQNDNLLMENTDLADWLKIDRLDFEKSMIQYDVYRKQQKNTETGEYYYSVELEEGAKKVASSKNERNKQYESAVKEFEKREEEKRKAEEAAAKEAAKKK